MFTADPPHITACAVAPMVREAIVLLNRRKLYDGRSDDLMQVVDDRLDQVQAAATMAHATSREGVFFQVCVAAGALDMLRPAEGDAGSVEDLRTAEVALASVAWALFSEDLRPLAAYYLGCGFNCALAA